MHYNLQTGFLSKMLLLKWLNTSQLCSAWAVLRHSEILRSPLSSEAHRASLCAGATNLQGQLPNSCHFGESGRDWTDGFQECLRTSLPLPQHLLLNILTCRVLLNTSAQGAVSRQGWGMMAWDQTQFQSIIWILWEQQVKLRRRCKGCTTLSAASFQHLWWCPLFKPLSLPSQMFFSFCNSRQQLVLFKTMDLFVTHLQCISGTNQPWYSSNTEVC